MTLPPTPRGVLDLRPNYWRIAVGRSYRGRAPFVLRVERYHGETGNAFQVKLSDARTGAVLWDEYMSQDEMLEIKTFFDEVWAQRDVRLLFKDDVP